MKEGKEEEEEKKDWKSIKGRENWEAPRRKPRKKMADGSCQGREKRG